MTFRSELSNVEIRTFEERTKHFSFNLLFHLLFQHPDVMIKGRTVDMSDIEADPVVQFQRKFYVPLYLFLRILMPLVIPCYYWGEILHYSVIGLFAQYIGALHATWFVNSGA